MKGWLCGTVVPWYIYWYNRRWYIYMYLVCGAWDDCSYHIRSLTPLYTLFASKINPCIFLISLKSFCFTGLMDTVGGGIDNTSKSHNIIFTDFVCIVSRRLCPPVLPIKIDTCKVLCIFTAQTTVLGKESFRKTYETCVACTMALRGVLDTTSVVKFNTLTAQVVQANTPLTAMVQVTCTLPHTHMQWNRKKSPHSTRE